jgi:hypothetical protein
MTRILKENERAIYAGETMHRAPDGKSLLSVPQFKVVPVDEADPARVYQLKENEYLVLAGREFNDMALARERFAALQAGHEPPPREKGIPLYFVVDKEGLSLYKEEQDAQTADISKDLTQWYSMHVRKEKVLERKNKDLV